MAYSEYTLTGFSPFLEQLRIAFAEPLPADYVCSTCGRVSADNAVLPCGHIVCGRRCPSMRGQSQCFLDGTPFKACELVHLRVPLSGLERRRVFCNVGGTKCPNFDGELSDLIGHMANCRGGANVEEPPAPDAAVDDAAAQIGGLKEKPEEWELVDADDVDATARRRQRHCPRSPWITRKARVYANVELE
ncbi:hypothetical protein HPB51_011867 [Rhipicephalus microplus]|uniref:RING-type domain-containing protein n=1 Tax=Rhipicephalus microplus TaxID=6941 RepID=A0A9J6E940_RHIMP|nr:hypothetical protein HPB51_011867 [Rhipicephalus microplus]